MSNEDASVHLQSKYTNGINIVSNKPHFFPWHLLLNNNFSLRFSALIEEKTQNELFFCSILDMLTRRKTIVTVDI